MTLTQLRTRYRPFEYPWAGELYERACRSLWFPHEVSMASDVLDWANASKADRTAIGGILRAFTLVEGHVSCYWGETVCQMFPKHEIQALARLFSFQETVHALAYNHLSETLGIDEHAAFLADPEAQRKVNRLINADPTDYATLGLFSGAVEGVSLFASFVGLLSLCAGGRFRGIQQILSWSTLDEDNHSKAGCRLYQTLRDEGLVTAEDDARVKDGFMDVVVNEWLFIDNIDLPDNSPLSAPMLKEYVIYRAKVCLERLGINTDGYAEVDYDKIRPILTIYEPQLLGNVSNDFFSHNKEGSGYVATPRLDSEQVNWSEL